jgi:sugar transferase EpsL
MNFVKRIVDLCGSITGLVLLLPLFILLAVLIRMKIGSPILFAQRRAGQGKKPFTIYKFRTMTDERDATGTLLLDEDRITPFGAWLRNSSLDEVPQLFNVLTGTLSLVGPRPLLMQYVPLYSSEQIRRLDVKPGITGWAQINGRNNLSWEEKFKLDVWYVDHRSLLLDIKILFLTIGKLSRREGISKDGHATMPFFKGSQ